MELEVKILIKEKELLYLERIFFIKGGGKKVEGKSILLWSFIFEGSLRRRKEDLL